MFDVTKITAIGPIDFTFNFTVRKSQASQLRVDLKAIKELSDLRLLFFDDNEKTNLNNNVKNVSVSTENNYINSLLFSNRSAIQKHYIEMISFGELKYSKKNQFIKNVINIVLNKNNLFLLESSLICVKPKMKFIIKILEDQNNSVIYTKSINLIESASKSDLTTGMNYYQSLNYKFDSDFLYTDFFEIIKIKQTNYGEVSLFFSLVMHNFPKIRIITSFLGGSVSSALSDISLMNTIKEIIEYSDVIICEKEEMEKFYKKYNSFYGKFNDDDDEEDNIEISDSIFNDKKKKRTMINRTIVSLDKFNTVNVVIQESYTMMIEKNVTYDIEKEIKDTKVVKNNYDFFRHIFVGGFLSRLFIGKCIKTCCVAGSLITKKMIDVFRYNIDFITDISFYQVVVPKPKKSKDIDRQMQLLRLQQKQREEGFNLDCTNRAKSSKKEYNALTDKNCFTFNTSRATKMHLAKVNGQRYEMFKPWAHKNMVYEQYNAFMNKSKSPHSNSSSRARQNPALHSFYRTQGKFNIRTVTTPGKQAIKLPIMNPNSSKKSFEGENGIVNTENNWFIDSKMFNNILNQYGEKATSAINKSPYYNI